MVRTSLVTYRKKRDFAKTPEPPGKLEKGAGGRFVVHEHHASRLHFDLRLEMGGVLKSYAVPKGPSMDPKDRRLAVETEDHPVKYLNFQGSIGDGQYGAGQMVIWDRGTYSVPAGEDPLEQYAQGKLHLQFAGEKLRGGFMLIRSARGDRQWLFFKKRDDEASEDSDPGLILPYGSRTEKPPGFEIPMEALRDKGENEKAGAGAATEKQKRNGHKKPTAIRSKPIPKGKPPAAAPPGSKAAALPASIQPMLATLVDQAFDDPDWLFESKWDGWRALLRKEGDQVRLVSRTGKSLDAMFPELLEAGKSVRAGSCMLDGEVVALDEQGIPRFQLLQGRLKGKAGKGGSLETGSKGRIVYYAFDMPYWEGFDLTACQLIDRKTALREVLSAAGDPALSGSMLYSEHFETRGQEVFRNAVRLGLEGVIAKLKAGPYIKGRSADWLKIKSKLRQEVVIAGYTEPRGTRSLFGSIVAGLQKDGELVFAGHVGGGFNGKSLKELYAFMHPLETKTCPFARVPKTNEKVHWIKPRLVAEAEFAEWTEDGLMRQPIYMGLRPDKDAKACVREVPHPTEALKQEAETAQTAEAGPEPRIAAKFKRDGVTSALTHPDKKLWPEDGFTKKDLWEYYRSVAPLLLPHLRDRPLILKRFPNGIDAPPFYQHDVPSAPDFVKLIPVKEPDGSENHYVLCQNAETLLWLANLGVIPQHPWLSRAPHLARPDWIVFDLDPQEVAFPDVCAMALYLKGVLDGLGLKAFAKTSGSRGIHVYLPLKPKYDFSQSLAFSQLVAEYAVRQKPDAFTVERSLKLRKRDRIYLDCMQNSQGKSVASVYSVRERPGAPVSAALEWGELKKKIAIGDFTIRTMPKRLARKGDLFAEVLRSGNVLEAALKKLERQL